MNESLIPPLVDEEITVVIAEDHALVSDGLKMLIRDILPHLWT
jgi:hypothetical protein